MEYVKRWLAKWSMLCAVACVYLFLYIPIVVLVLFSFNKGSYATGWTGFSLGWYHQLFASTYIWHAFLNSLIVAISTTVISLCCALGLIYFYSIHNRSSSVFKLFYGNVIVPEIVLAVGLLSLFSFLGVPLGLISLTVAHTVLALGYTVPLLYSRFDALDPRLTEASYDLGATPGQTFIKVTMPLLTPAISAAGLLVFILSFDDFILSFFCAGNEAQTLSLYIFSLLRSGTSPVLNALSTLLLAFSSLLVLIFCSLNVRTRIF